MKREDGAVMVETTIIFPIVLLAVMSMLYLGLFKLQEAAVLQQVQRVAHQGSMVLASPGYKTLGDYRSSQVDFTDASPEDIGAYYQAAHADFQCLYREIFGYQGWTGEEDMIAFSDSLIDSVMLFSAGNLVDNDVELKRSFFGTSIVSTVSIKLPTPSVMKLFTDQDVVIIRQSAYAKAIQPSGFIRNTDLAADAVVYASDKLGLKDDLNKLVNDFNKVRDILF